MPRDYRLYLDDILQAIDRIMLYVQGVDLTGFSADTKTVDAVVRNLEIIGEAARNLPTEIRAKAPEVEWPKIISLRNVLSHEYFGVNTLILWDIVQNKLKPLRTAAENIMRLIDQ
jgi:uncharacterized protein with HEPN domain